MGKLKKETTINKEEAKARRARKISIRLRKPTEKVKAKANIINEAKAIDSMETDLAGESDEEMEAVNGEAEQVSPK